MPIRSHRIALFATLAVAAVAGGFFGLTLTGGGAGGGVAMAAPEPDPVPRRWQLTLEPGPLRVMTVDPDADGPETARMFYYLTYKVINNSGQDLLFTPSFDLATDEGDLQRSGRAVPRAVTDQIITALENEFLQDQISIVGMLLQGEENAKEGLAVWPVGSSHVRDLRVFANGFSGETRTLDAYDAETKGTKRVVLRKTLMLRYQPLGETRDMGAEGLPKIEERWVMR
jgi:hypothetical protein